MLSGAKPSISRPGKLDRLVLLLAAAFVGVMSAEALMYVQGIDTGIFVLRALGVVPE
jgi:hypothetical protein